MNCLMCQLPIVGDQWKEAERTKGGDAYHKICFDIAVASLAEEIGAALREKGNK